MIYIDLNYSLEKSTTDQIQVVHPIHDAPRPGCFIVRHTLDGVTNPLSFLDDWHRS